MSLNVGGLFMTTDLILFIILAVIAVVTAVSMLLGKNAVYSALFLVLNFVTVAVLYLLLNAAFIALVQVTVYAGAIMVLFLFVIMLLGAEQGAADARTLPWQLPVALISAAVLIAELGFVLLVKHPDLSNLLGAVSEGFGSPRAVGELLFNRYLIPFEVTSILLLVAMIGAIVIVRNDREVRR